MERIAIFSHYSKFNIIEDYVVYLLKELKNYTDKIIFVSDCDNIADIELNKIQNYIHKSIIQNHQEYDFGSYKRGFEYILENNLLSNCEELIFINDSCYAPLFSFSNMFNKMSNENVDFWGITTNFNTYLGLDRHIQSYFLAFKSQVFESKVFKDFVLSISKEKSKKSLVRKYEIGLTKTLTNAGFKYDVMSEFSKNHYAAHILYFKDIVKRDKVPFIKRSIPLLKAEVVPIGFKKLIIRNTNYDYDLINSDLYNRQKMSFQYILVMLFKLLVRNLFIFIRNINKWSKEH